MAYDHAKLSQKYTEIWQKERTYEPDLKAAPRPYYNLMMFPYPSAEGLHVGNMYAFTGADVHGRFRRMLGYDVFEPIGLDGFGIHSENYAIKIGKHPQEQAKISEENFYRQLLSIGNGFSWENRLETYDPAYYRWTQWLFLQMFKHGLAYKAEALVNWCPKDKTVLSDEQVEGGVCERCKTPVVRRSMSSWFLKITDYADRLLDNIDNYAWKDADGGAHQGLKWPAKVTVAQKNWIGRHPGLDIEFQLAENSSATTVTVWTTYWETIFGATFLVLAPEHPLAAKLATGEHQSAVEEYIQAALNRSEQDRQADKEKTGIFTGAYVINPATGEKIPVWVADYVLTSVGTGAVMGVAAHDERDLAFAQKFDLPVVPVLAEGKMVSSGEFTGAEVGLSKPAMKAWLIDRGLAKERTHYHLRDWLISRQRYWGPPIPLLYCHSCAEQGKGERPELPGWYAVDEQQLPVILPHLDDFTPKGEGTSPLDNAPDDWRLQACPGCGGQAERETDVSDVFLDSSWYFLRYPSTRDNSGPFPHIEGTPKPGQASWFPVDAYIGGAEHAILHLLYARFVTQALADWKLVPSEEPFPYLFGHGLIIKDGAKMSKSRGNVVNPDEYIEKYGADALRAYLMFLGPYDQGGDFRDTGMNGMYKWLAKVWEVFQTIDLQAATTDSLRRQVHQVIAANTADLYQFKYNTCLARLMEVLNSWRSGQTMGKPDGFIFLQLLAPFAPFLAEELYQQLRAKQGEAEFVSIHRSDWPKPEQALLMAETVRVAVQVNGKLRGTLEVAAADSADASKLEEQAKGLESVRRHLTSEPKKVIVIPGKIVNFVL